MAKPKKSGRVSKTHVPPKRPVSDEEQYGESTNPFPEIHEAMAKEELRRKMEKEKLKVVDNMYNVVIDEGKKKKIKKTAKELSEIKNYSLGKSVKADSDIDMSRGQAGYNFKGVF